MADLAEEVHGAGLEEEPASLGEADPYPLAGIGGWATRAGIRTRRGKSPPKDRLQHYLGRLLGYSVPRSWNAQRGLLAARPR